MHIYNTKFGGVEDKISIYLPEAEATFPLFLYLYKQLFGQDDLKIKKFRPRNFEVEIYMSISVSMRKRIYVRGRY